MKKLLAAVLLSVASMSAYPSGKSELCMGLTVAFKNAVDARDAGIPKAKLYEVANKATDMKDARKLLNNITDLAYDNPHMGKEYSDAVLVACMKS